MIILLIFICLEIFAQDQLLYLQDGEGLMILNDSRYINSSIIYQDDELFHNEQIIQQIIQQNLQDCQNLISIKQDKQENQLNIYIFYLTYNRSYQFDNYKIIFRNMRYDNRIQIYSIEKVQTREFEQANLECYDFYYSQEYSILYIICKYHLQDAFLLITYQNTIKDITLFTLDKTIFSDNCKQLLMWINNNLHLIICFQYQNLSIYQIDLSNKNNVATLKFSINDSCSFCFQIRYNKYLLGDQKLYFYNEQSCIIINLQDWSIFQKFSSHSLLFIYEEFHSVYMIQDNKIKKIFQQQTVKYINQTREQLEYHYFGKYRILSNNTHLVINNQYKLIKINNLIYIGQDILLIYFQNQFQLFQISFLGEILFMNRNKISIKASQLSLINLNYFDTPQQKLTFSSTINVNTNQIMHKFTSQEIPFLKLENQQQVDLEIDFQILQIPIQLQQIQKKHLLQMYQEKDNSLYQVWITSKNKTLYLELYRCYLTVQCNQDADFSEKLMNIQQNYSMWVQQVDTYQIFKELIILLQSDSNDDIYLYQFQFSQKSVLFEIYMKNFTNLTIQSVALSQEQIILQIDNCFLVYFSSGIREQQLNMTMNKSSIILMERQRLIWFTQNSLVLSTIDDFTHLNMIHLRNVSYHELLKFSFNYFVLIYVTNQTFLEQYYLSPENCMVLLKQLPILEYNIIYPFKIKISLPSYFSIEAIDGQQNKRILLYDISYPSLYSLKHISKIKSQEYIIDNFGRLLFIHQEHLEIIQHDTLLVIKDNINFQGKIQLNQLSKIEFKILKLQISILISITYQNQQKQILIAQNKLSIIYDSYIKYYVLPIQNICKGNIEDIKLINDEYLIIKPFQIINNQITNQKLVYQFNETHFLSYQERNNKNYLIYSKIAISKQLNFIEFFEINSIEENQHRSYKWVYEINVQQQRYIVIIKQLQWLELYFYKMDDYQIYSSIQFKSSIQLISQIKNIFQLSQNKLLLQTETDYMDLEILQVEIKIQVNVTYKVLDPQFNYYQNYQISKGNYLMTVQQFNSISFEFETKFTVSYPYQKSDSTIFQIIKISNNFLIVLYEDTINELNFLQYNNGEYKYFSIIKPYLRLTVRSIQLLNDNIIMIEYIQNVEFVNLYYIENLINHQKVYSLQQFELETYEKIYKIEDQQILLSSIQRIKVAQINKFYQIEIRNPKVVKLNLLIYNSQDQEIIQIKIHLKLQQFYFIIIVIFIFIQILFIECKINQKKIYY